MNAFCAHFNIRSLTLPCDGSFLADQGLTPQTGKWYLAVVHSMQVSLGLPDHRNKSLPMLKRVQVLIAERTQLWSGSILGVPNVINSELEPTSFLGAQVILSAQSKPLLSTLPSVALVQVSFSSSHGPRRLFVDQLHATLSAMELPQHLYAGHSFHIGAATTVEMAGVEDAMIQALGRLAESCLRAAYVQYVRMPSEHWPRLSAVLARNAT